MVQETFTENKNNSKISKNGVLFLNEKTDDHPGEKNTIQLQQTVYLLKRKTSPVPYVFVLAAFTVFRNI